MFGRAGANAGVDRNSAQSSALFGIVLVIATAGLIYELAIAAVASYLLGDTVTQFSLVIGVYLSALGLGAYLSRYVDRDVTITFVRVEFATALIGGLSVIGLELSFSFGAPFRVLLLLTVLAVGVLVGLELPLLMRILEQRMTFRDLIARALGFDYIGALLGSLGFSLWLLPQFGLAQTALICGLLNVFVGLASTWLLVGQTPKESRSLRGLRWLGLVLIAGLGTILWKAEPLTRLGERQIFGNIVHAVQSPYQRILVTKRKGNLDLFLNGRLQFSSSDEVRYHEALVHPVLAAATQARRVFVGGGGDGLAVREILKWKTVESVTLVDIDSAITRLASTQSQLVRLNRQSLLNKRVHVVNADAMIYLASASDIYDVILLDFPDPTQLALGKLYTTQFYTIVRNHLSPAGALGVQCTSPLLTRQSFWSIISTLEAVGLKVIPYRAFVPSFGDWGFAVARREPFEFPRSVPLIPMATLDRDTLRELTVMPIDTQRVPAKVNSLNNQALVAVYLKESARFE